MPEHFNDLLLLWKIFIYRLYFLYFMNPSLFHIVLVLFYMMHIVFVGKNIYCAFIICELHSALVPN